MNERLEKLVVIRDEMEELYAKVVAEIRREVLADALVKLVNTPGVIEYLNQQNLQDST